ncbi:hypothetical protein VF14_08730 [Nostoc linckia z18]|uniref:Uncharacterized protein n=2 Tax=Nostoc linckia TaxID=92942 RepID=A0A9Q5ZEK4_NOSLI|nr:hypothetical protein [Nostoc linckia]PHJ59554.1 hypothetical protein VF02_24355 [Nostoc linckia z1]PHJ65169.1 hypothetical protein VF05_21795 [Nostoc linckia z3]PHJ69557.1 hypothetical protein VF03_23435 [Nostoc linckia z2]PHJ86254.1 hypothetical protein VF07_22080 [Nostoc linckia z6]PHJ96300.1 hypothetical protein VF04_16570 [Nostoc linckia z7]PHK05320.1 hypothetical protein VF08_08035 [Nostoc linckia z8]PHK22625.1 hypothetical protein VF11_04545 [Nostoc linckia z14]PHK35736.1 hypotheti
MKIFYAPADSILDLVNEEAIIADTACCEDWFWAVDAIALLHEIPYSEARKAIVDRYRNQRVLSLYGICKAIVDGTMRICYLAESAR